MLILAIESSCDDTAAAVLEDDGKILSNIISSQFDVHARFGGIVPELASRRHIEAIWPVVREALDQAEVDLGQVDLIAATRGPGLIGSLLVGFTFAKGLALVKNIPCVGVDHMAGHLLSPFLEQPRPAFPYIALVVSGGNSSIYTVTDQVTYQCLGRTRDDAAGEAFDKVAKFLGLDYPGGPAVSRYAENGDPGSIFFPRAWLGRDSLDFSFSGLKTAVINHVHTLRQRDIPLPVEDICASFQEAVVEVLVEKTIRAAARCSIRTVVMGGGVASNRHLRDRMKERCDSENLKLFVPQPVFCTDNAAMIGLAGYFSYQQGHCVSPDTDVYSRSPLT
jgi:N6-L-threonylcarbamoyladenine synthase